MKAFPAPAWASSSRLRLMAMATAAIAVICTLGAANAATFEVAELFDRLAKARPASARFHERKYLALLAQPVESSGELTFTPPDRLEKVTTSPKREAIIVEGTQLVLERNGRKQTLDLAQNPGVAVLVASIRGTLAGDLASLSRDYSIQLDGQPSDWRMVLRPVAPDVSTLVERVEIGGVDAQVRTVAIFQADGDRSVMTISQVPAR